MIAFLDRKARMRRQIDELFRCTVLRQIIGRRAQYPMIRRKPLRDQMRRDVVADADIEVEAFTAYVNKPVEQVAEAVGYRDSTALRRLMKRVSGANPGRYRPAVAAP